MNTDQIEELLAFTGEHIPGNLCVSGLNPKGDTRGTEKPETTIKQEIQPWLDSKTRHTFAPAMEPGSCGTAQDEEERQVLSQGRNLFIQLMAEPAQTVELEKTAFSSTC